MHLQLVAEVVLKLPDSDNRFGPCAENSSNISNKKVLHLAHKSPAQPHNPRSTLPGHRHVCLVSQSAHLDAALPTMSE